MAVANIVVMPTFGDLLLTLLTYEGGEGVWLLLLPDFLPAGIQEGGSGHGHWTA